MIGKTDETGSHKLLATLSCFICTKSYDQPLTRYNIHQSTIATPHQRVNILIKAICQNDFLRKPVTFTTFRKAININNQNRNLSQVYNEMLMKISQLNI